MGYSPRYDAELVVAELTSSGIKKLGVLAPDGLPSSLIRAIEKIDRLDISDATDLVDTIKAVKSPEELQQVHAACALQDAVMAKVLGFIRPGLRDIDIINFAPSRSAAVGV